MVVVFGGWMWWMSERRKGKEGEGWRKCWGGRGVAMFLS